MLTIPAPHNLYKIVVGDILYSNFCSASKHTEMKVFWKFRHQLFSLMSAPQLGQKFHSPTPS